MLTTEATPVNGTPRAVMMSIAEIADRDRVSKPAVSRKVKQLRDSGLVVELDAQKRVAKVNVAQYDALRGRHDDPSKAQAPMSPSAAVATATLEPDNESYNEARRVLTWVEAERAKLKLEAEQGEYVKVDELIGAVQSIGEEIVGVVDRLTQSSDDLAAAVAKDGVHGLRSALKKLAFEMKTEIADALTGLANRDQS